MILYYIIVMLLSHRRFCVRPQFVFLSFLLFSNNPSPTLGVYIIVYERVREFCHVLCYIYFFLTCMSTYMCVCTVYVSTLYIFFPQRKLLSCRTVDLLPCINFYFKRFHNKLYSDPIKYIV